MIQPLIRTNRALSSILIYPQHPITAIAISEMISVFGPFFSPNIYNKIILLTTTIIYYPTFTNSILKNHFAEIGIYIELNH